MSEKPQRERGPRSQVSDEELYAFREALLSGDLRLPAWNGGEYQSGEPLTDEEAVQHFKTIDQTNLNVREWVMTAERRDVLLQDRLKKFRALLESEGFHRRQIDAIFELHVLPVQARISELRDEIGRLTDGQAEGPTEGEPQSAQASFLALQQRIAKGQANEETTRSLTELRNQLSNSLTHLMRSIIEHPEQFHLDSDAALEPHIRDVTISSDELAERLDTYAPAEVFLVNGQEMTPANKLAVCRDLVKTTYESQIECFSELMPVLNRRYFNSLWEEYQNGIKTKQAAHTRDGQGKAQAALREIDAKLTLFMSDLLAEGGFDKYVNWAVEGAPDHDDSDKVDEAEFMAVDFPGVRLGEPEIVRLLRKNRQDPNRDTNVWRAQVEAAHRLVTGHHYLDVYPPQQRTEEGEIAREQTLARIKRLYMEGDISKRDEIVRFPTGAFKPEPVVAAELLVLFQEEGWSDEDFNDIYVTEIGPIFEEIIKINKGVYDHEDARTEKMRGLVRTKLLKQADEKLIRVVHRYLTMSPEDRLLARFQIEGAAGGRKLIEMAPTESVDQESMELQLNDLRQTSDQLPPQVTEEEKATFREEVDAVSTLNAEGADVTERVTQLFVKRDALMQRS